MKDLLSASLMASIVAVQPKIEKVNEMEHNAIFHEMAQCVGTCSARCANSCYNGCGGDCKGSMVF